MGRTGHGDEEGSAAPHRVSRPTSAWLSVLVNVLVALVIVALVQAFLVRVHSVSSGSMLQTLSVHDRVLSSTLPYLASEPQVGDIIIFGHGDTWETDRRTPASNPALAALRTFGDLTGIGVSNTIYTVKRVLGTPGDTVACCDDQGRVTVNGESLDEPYVFEDFAFEPGSLDCTSDMRSGRCFGPLLVPEGRLLVLGDHRTRSADSVAACRSPGADARTCAQYVRRERVTGKVIAKAVPPGPVR